MRALSRLAVGFTVVPLATVLGLMIAVANVLEDATYDVARTMHDAELAGTIERHLLSYQRASNLAVATEGEESLELRSQIAGELRGAIEETSAVPRDGRRDGQRDELVQRLRSDSAAYIGARARLERLALPISDVIRRSRTPLDRAVAAARRLRAYDLARVRAAESYAERVGQLLLVVGLLSIGTTTAIAILLLWFLRRAVLQPVSEIRDAIHRFRTDPSARIEAAMPVELDALADEVNGFLERLAAQRKTQLAFLAGVVHDIRNPVAVLHGSVRRVLDEEVLSESHTRRMLDLIERQLYRLNRLLGDLLDAYQLESGQLDIRLERVDLRAVLREVEDLYLGLSPIHALLLHLPEKELCAEVDPARIVQVVNNLVSNAIKYSPRGGRVEVTLRTDGPEAVLSVSDQGVGIEASEIDSIFEPFRRSARRRDSVPGAGLGLSAVQKIIEAHRGTIEVDSVPGIGSTFRVRIPLTRPGPPST